MDIVTQSKKAGYDYLLVLKQTDKNRRSYNGYRYGDVGDEEEIRDYDNDPICNDKGFYGWAWGYGVGDGKDLDILNSKFVILRVPISDVIQVGSKVKFKKYKIEKWFDTFLEAKIYLLNYFIKICGKGEQQSKDYLGQSGSSSSVGQSGSHSSAGQSGDSSSIGQSGSRSSAGQSGHYSSVGQSGPLSSVGQSGDYSSIGQSGYYSSVGQSGLRSSAGQSGGYSSVEQSGHYSACAITGEGCKVDTKYGCISVAAKVVYWRVRKDSALVQWWKDSNNKVNTKFFKGSVILRKYKIKDGQVVKIEKGEVRKELSNGC